MNRKILPFFNYLWVVAGNLNICSTWNNAFNQRRDQDCHVTLILPVIFTWPEIAEAADHSFMNIIELQELPHQRETARRLANKGNQ